MSARPTTWGPLTWGVFTLGVLVVLVHLPWQVSACMATFSALGLVSLADDHRREEASRIREALRMCGISVTKAAEEYMQWDVREFERALAGERKLDWWRIEMLPLEVRQVYAVLKLRDLGFPEFIQNAVKWVPIIHSMDRSA